MKGAISGLFIFHFHLLNTVMKCSKKGSLDQNRTLNLIPGKPKLCQLSHCYCPFCLFLSWHQRIQGPDCFAFVLNLTRFKQNPTNGVCLPLYYITYQLVTSIFCRKALAETSKLCACVEQQKCRKTKYNSPKFALFYQS